MNFEAETMASQQFENDLHSHGVFKTRATFQTLLNKRVEFYRCASFAKFPVVW